MRRAALLFVLRCVAVGTFIDGGQALDTLRHAVTGEPEARVSWTFERP